MNHQLGITGSRTDDGRKSICVNNAITDVLDAPPRCAKHEKGTAWTQPYGERSNSMIQALTTDPHYQTARLDVAGIYAYIHTLAAAPLPGPNTEPPPSTGGRV